MSDWLISKKNRYWGLALPIFECEKCGNFQVIGGKDELKEKTGKNQESYLKNPQQFNSYSYTINNPLAFRDKNGEFVFLAAPIVAYAPVWVPAAITGIAFAGASIQSWFMGQAIGQAMEGNFQGANQSLENVQTTGAMVGGMAVGLVGAGALMSGEGAIVKEYFEKLCREKIQLDKWLPQIAYEYYAYGDCFVLLEMEIGRAHV